MSSMDAPIDEDEPGYRPLKSEQRTERIRQWHEGAYRRAMAGGEHTFSYLGRALVVPPQAMPITPMSDLLGKAVLAEVKGGDRVLDMGTGSGVNAVLAASKAAEVLAVDINPHALAAARDNALRNGVADRVEVRRSNVFSNLRELIARLCRLGAACSAPTHLRRVAAGGDPAARRGVAGPAGVVAVPGWVRRWAWPTARGRHDRAWAEGRVGR